MTTIFDPYTDATETFDPEWDETASQLLNQKFLQSLRINENLRIESYVGKECVLLKAFLGHEKRAQVFEFFTKKNPFLDESKAFGLLLDFFDGVLEYYFKHQGDARLPLDFCSRRFENIELWARQEFRNFEAEQLADAILDADTIKNTQN